jgi:hypothetical protein
MRESQGWCLPYERKFKPTINQQRMDDGAREREREGLRFLCGSPEATLCAVKQQEASLAEAR